MEKTNEENSKTSELINVSYDLRNQVKLFVGERSKTQFDSGCKMFDLNLHEPHQVMGRIQFSF